MEGREGPPDHEISINRESQRQGGELEREAEREQGLGENDRSLFDRVHDTMQRLEREGRIGGEGQGGGGGGGESHGGGGGGGTGGAGGDGPKHDRN